MALKQTSKSTRPPIVAILGHVDHGKTSLLDRIRRSREALKEAGGITQKIGAHQVSFNDQKITFIDTPGHQAFSAMRSRGAAIADIGILVVAADDGVMPQTLESFEHLRLSKTPFLVAINKIDVLGVDLEKTKKQLSDNGIKIEGYGGDVVCVPVSAKTGEGIDELLEMILLLAEMGEIKADPLGVLEAVVIEAKMAPGGPVGTLIVKNGTLKKGDQILVEKTTVKVKGMIDDRGLNIAGALPGQPVEVLGFVNLPPVGAKVTQSLETAQGQTSVRSKITMPENVEGRLKMILRVDSLGSLEALEGSLPAFVLTLYSAVGDVSESDVMTAKGLGAEIVGFNIKIPPQVLKLAETEKVKVKTYKIIYELLDDLEKSNALTVDQAAQKAILGRAKVVAVFNMANIKIAGCQVLEGRINISDSVILKRAEREIGQIKIVSMKHQKTEIKEATLGEEFGAVFAPPLDFKINDMILSARSA